MILQMLPVLALAAAGIGSNNVAARAKDWRIGPVVYQIFIDRFAPPENPEAKRAAIRPPRVLMTWNDTPKPGKFVPALGVWSQELEFWGGDLNGIANRLSYIDSLGANVVYLSPINKAATNHRYDTEDYTQIAPELGTQQDFTNLADGLHRMGLKLMLDGVYNHIGRTSPIFETALNQPVSSYRNWFYFDDKYKTGYRCFAGAPSLPCLNLENPEVRNYLWRNQDSIVRRWLRNGADGLRLDVAYEIGPEFLDELTKAAHETKPDSDIVGEIVGYPSDWFPAVDGVYNLSMIDVAMKTLSGEIPGGRAGLIFNHMVIDAGIEHLLRSWLVVDSQDTPRLADRVPDPTDRKLLQAVQFTLPGAPVIYYGTELGMTGSGDPQNRAPMRWDLANDKNPTLAWVRKLTAIRKKRPALRYGDFAALDTDRLLAYVRTTGKIAETTFVVVNPTASEVHDIAPIRVGRLQNLGPLKDLLTGTRVSPANGLLTLTVPAKTAMILVPAMDKPNGYSPFHRIN
jgi:glycosidase